MPNSIGVSIVTPSYNSARYIERTIQSILRQDIPKLEYIIIDGNSQDGTQDIIRRYEDQLHYWISEPDKGMYDALQKGFDKSTGEIMGWLNSDDIYGDWTLKNVVTIFETFPEVEWITSLRPLIWDLKDNVVDVNVLPGYSKRGFFQGEYSGVSRFIIQQIQQESTFWRRSLWDRAGARMDTSLRLAGDFELWSRFFQHSELIGVPIPLGGIMLHGEQMTVLNQDKRDAEERQVLERYHAKLHSPMSAWLRRNLAKAFPKRLNRFAYRLGIRQKSRNAYYDIQSSEWKLKEVYF